jgi:hypothetical protein
MSAIIKALHSLPHGDRICEQQGECTCGRDAIIEQVSAELAAKDAALEAARVIITKLVGYGMMADKYITLGDTDALVAALDAIQKAKP